MTNLRNTFKYLAFFLVLAVVAYLPVKSFAQVNVCNPPEGWYQKIQNSFDRNIRETAVNHLTSAVADFSFNAATGTEMAEYMNCASYVGEYMPCMESEMQSWGCDATDEQTCQNIVNQFVAFDGSFDRKAFASAKTSGSLLGMGQYVYNYMHYEPVPVNTAYFFNDYGTKIPIIGEKVFAADTVDYQHTLINSVLEIWKIARNAAYALMAIIMLYVGITIIGRKKISQQVVVSVQYALPKVMLSLVLIAFSYPIGATIASLSWSLFYSVDSIIESLGASTSCLAVDPSQVIGVGSLIGVILLGLIGTILVSGGAGLAVGIVVSILVVVVLIMYLMTMFKALMLFIKMVISIVTAPLEFAVGAIPGNESKISDWFKRMAAYGLGIIGVQATVSLIHMFGLEIINAQAENSLFSGYLFAVFGSVFILIFGYSFALKVPGKIEAALMGPPKRK